MTQDKENWTPGPWEVRKADTQAEWDVMTADGFYVATTFEMLGENDRNETLPNAHLIAAAPALYDALIALEQYYCASGTLWDDARAALDLAKGQS